MSTTARCLTLCLLTSLSFLSISCATLEPALVTEPLPPPEIVQIPVLVVPENITAVPKGSRIVIAGLEGDCANSVKDALMKRLIDNQNYSVLTRDNLNQIIGESDLSWAGRFNTETAAKLGRLMGASLWIVGRVAYCGQSFASSVDRKTDAEFSVIAHLQIIDLSTGQVLVSSSSEGRYIPRDLAEFDLAGAGSSAPPPDLLDGAGEGDENLEAAGGRPAEEPPAGTEQEPGSPSKLADFRANLAKRARSLMSHASGQVSDLQKLGEKSERKKKVQEYIVMKAAEDMANGFADKFFSRPVWEDVEMWTNPRWTYGDAIRPVKLGHCPAAVKSFEGQAAEELPRMTERETAEYLHNYGVALLCANEVDMAVDKLRASYRIATSPSTLKMLGLAGRISEWSLEVAIESQPEVNRFLSTETR